MQFNILSQLHGIVKCFLKKSGIFQKFSISALKNPRKMQTAQKSKDSTKITKNPPPNAPAAPHLRRKRPSPLPRKVPLRSHKAARLVCGKRRVFCTESQFLHSAESSVSSHGVNRRSLRETFPHKKPGETSPPAVTPPFPRRQTEPRRESGTRSVTEGECAKHPQVSIATFYVPP